jgi:hypothetical protein
MKNDRSAETLFEIENQNNDDDDNDDDDNENFETVALFNDLKDFDVNESASEFSTFEV